MFSPQFFKEDGCNKMTCACGAKMCYICKAEIKDYTHFYGQVNIMIIPIDNGCGINGAGR